MLSLTFRAALGAVFGVAAQISSPAAPESRSAWQHLQQRATATLRELETAPAPSVQLVPSVPQVELVYDQLFEPMGERGLAYTETLRQLEGRTVQVTGWIVREAERAPGTFLVTSRPMRTDWSGGSGDLPPATLHVILAPSRSHVRPGYRPGVITLVGVLGLGAQPMPDARNSVLRLHLDEAASRLVLAEDVP